MNLTVNPLIGGVTLQPSRSKTVLGTLDGVTLDLRGNKKTSDHETSWGMAS